MDPMSLAGDWSSLSLIPFLVYAHVKAGQRQELMEAKMDAQREAADSRFEAMAKGWQKQLDSMLEKHETRENEIRDRWMAIVEKLETQKAEQSDKIVEELKALSARVEDVIRFIARPAGR